MSKFQKKPQEKQQRLVVERRETANAVEKKTAQRRTANSWLQKKSVNFTDFLLNFSSHQENQFQEICVLLCENG